MPVIVESPVVINSKILLIKLICNPSRAGSPCR